MFFNFILRYSNCIKVKFPDSENSDHNFEQSTEKNSLRNFTQLLSKVEIYGQVGDYLILL